MTTTTSTITPATTSIDIAGLEVLCSLYLARKYGESQPHAWCDDAPGVAAARLVGVNSADFSLDAETSFSSGFELGMRIAVAIAGNPLGDTSAALDAEIAASKSWLDGFRRESSAR